MTFFVPLWVLALCGFVFGAVYFFIGWCHFAFDAGTSYRPGKLRYLFFWPFEWLRLIFGMLWQMIKMPSRR